MNTSKDPSTAIRASVAPKPAIIESDPIKARRWLAAASLVLVIACLITFWPVTGHEFLSLDDNIYITGNDEVKKGLTLEGVQWAFTATYFSYWHPLTWISHMADVEMFGLNPQGHHTVSLIWHCINVVILLLLLWRVCGKIGLAFWVTAFYALHPLRVEVVAWSASRKDLLCAFFILLTLHAYLSYGHKPRVWRYLLVCLLGACAMMSKPFAITLPAVLLLVDFWPLGRKRLPWLKPTPDAASEPPALATNPPRWPAPQAGWLRLIVEKIPLLILGFLSLQLAIDTQIESDSLKTLSEFTLTDRFVNAMTGYGVYLYRHIVPTDLAIWYPYHYDQPLSKGIIAMGGLLAVTILAALLSRKRPYLLIAWVWYLGVMLPVIGLVQIGGQSTADRYMYIGSFGLLLAAVALVTELTKRWNSIARLAVVPGLIFVFTLGVMAWTYTLVYRDNISIYSHSIAVTENNWIANLNLGLAYSEMDDYDRAAYYYKKVLEVNPANALAHNNLAVDYRLRGNWEESIRRSQQALKSNPNLRQAHQNLAQAFFLTGQYDMAIFHAVQFLKLNSDGSHRTVADDESIMILRLSIEELGLGPEVLDGLAPELKPLIQSKTEDVLTQDYIFRVQRFRKARHEGQRYLLSQLNSGSLSLAQELKIANQLASGNQLHIAADIYRKAINLNPEQHRIRYNLARTLLKIREYPEAEEQVDLALAVEPNSPPMLNLKGRLRYEAKDYTTAIQYFQAALKNSPGYPAALVNLETAKFRLSKSRQQAPGPAGPATP